ncbi:MAG TPA: hypothetical protein VMW25_05850, partial [Clostridia bacterium]|nr:hypothetical protein [Clostridia bacterium]
NEPEKIALDDRQKIALLAVFGYGYLISKGNGFLVPPFLEKVGKMADLTPKEIMFAAFKNRFF